MSTLPHAHWPAGLPAHQTLPETHLFYNLEVSATRYPDKACMVFYDTPVGFERCRRDAERLAGYLQQACGVRRGDRVLLDLQNSPQWLIACYAIWRAGAVVVPVNPMNRTEELRHIARDSGARAAFVAQDLVEQMRPLLGAGEDADGETGGLRHLIVATYADWLQAPTDLPVPDVVAAPRLALSGAGVVAWNEALARGLAPAAVDFGADDMAAMPYTSGTTGQPKACVHTHRSVMATVVGGVRWFARGPDDVYLSPLPFFHVTGFSGSLHGPVYAGATIVVLARWDREAAGRAIERWRVTTWQLISTMLIDFLADPAVTSRDLSSLTLLRGGGAAMPEAVGARLKALVGLEYVEGYGMSETMAATHINPPQRPKRQCLGIPLFDVDARIVDPATLAEVPAGEIGEIVIHGPQVMRGYWNHPQANAEAFVEIDGKRFLRTGDLAQVDEDGYFFMVDRLKRMINAAGYKVWPAEVEAMMYRHPAIHEACVIGTHDARRGETVKALVVLTPGFEGTTTEADLVAWCHAQMAPYKAPRVIEFVASLPKSGAGKVLWRELQARETAASGGPAAR